MFGFTVPPIQTSEWVGLTTLAGTFLNLVAVPLIAEWRAGRLRKWTIQQQEITHEQIGTVRQAVEAVGQKADDAYHEANNVNQWRGDMTRNLMGAQVELLRNQEHLKVVASETKEAVQKQLDRPTVTPLVILPPAPIEEEVKPA